MLTNTSPVTKRPFEHRPIEQGFLVSETDIDNTSWQYILPLDLYWRTQVLNSLTEGEMATLIELIKRRSRPQEKPVLLQERTNEAQDSHIVSIEEAKLFARQTSLKEKVNGLLRNLISLEKTPGAGIDVVNFSGDGGTSPQEKEHRDTRLRLFGYRSSLAEIHLGLRWLKKQGYIEVNKNDGLNITLEGYEYNESNRIEEEQSQHVFVVCAFKNVTDEVFEKRFLPTSALTGRDIFRISDHEYNGKIDDEILLKIRKAAVVVVDVERSNFNVGFEAGYAEALGKPVVYTMQGEVTEEKKPLDITVRNLIAEPNDDELFVRRLSNRIKLVAPTPIRS